MKWFAIMLLVYWNVCLCNGYVVAILCTRYFVPSTCYILSVSIFAITQILVKTEEMAYGQWIQLNYSQQSLNSYYVSCCDNSQGVISTTKSCAPYKCVNIRTTVRAGSSRILLLANDSVY